MLNRLYPSRLLPAVPALIALMVVLGAGLAADLARAQSESPDAPAETETEPETEDAAAAYALPDGFVARNPEGRIVVEEFLDYY